MELNRMVNWQGLIKEYAEYLPVSEDTPRLTLHEGDTPLIRLDTLSEKYGSEIYAKYEGANPTGSFKDRGMVMVVAKEKADGLHAVIRSSTGITSASAAAYASRAGLNTIVVIPEGKIALGKLAQEMMYGANIVYIEGNFDEALKVVRKIAEEKKGITLVNS